MDHQDPVQCDARPTEVVPVAIRGGGATLRPLRSGEDSALDAVFYALSPASRYDRYLTGLPRLTEAMRATLSDIDGQAHIAWLSEVDGHPVAIGRLVRTAARTAEIAVEVADDHQGRGLGTALLDTLLTVASVTGTTRVQATLLPTNHRSLRMLRAIGMRFQVEGGILGGTATVRLLDPPVVDRAAVVRLALDAHDQVRRPEGPA